MSFWAVGVVIWTASYKALKTLKVDTVACRAGNMMMVTMVIVCEPYPILTLSLISLNSPTCVPQILSILLRGTEHCVSEEEIAR